MNTNRLCPGCMTDNGGEQVCCACGYDRANKNDVDKLPVYFLLADRYSVGAVLAVNVECITYMGYDLLENKAVNIREYFPADASDRNSNKTVMIKSGKEFVFNEGLMNFMEINNKLIASELPSLFDTYAVFEENGTVYSISAPIAGITLKSFLERNGGSLKWEQARPLFLPLIDTVKGLHEEGIIHGGISPESIFVGRDGRLRLSEICGLRIRRVSEDMSTSIYSGYAAAEQYGRLETQIGPYTDVYGISAVLFRVLIGTVPPQADTRLENDSLTIPAHFAEELPRQVLVSIANGMQADPEKRTQTVEVFKNELVYGETRENELRAAAKRDSENAEKKKPLKKKSKSGVKSGVIAAVCTGVLFLSLAAILCFTVFKNQIFGSNKPVVSDSEISEMPSVPSIGDVDAGAAESKVVYTVPDFTGMYYSKIVDNDEYEHFKFAVSDKEYSDKFARGTVCSQTVLAGSEVSNETLIAFVISLGPREFKIANVVGLDENSAKIELLKQGFLYENIEVVDMYDSERKPGIVLEQTPEYGSSVSSDIAIRIYVNSYEGEENNP